MEESGLLPFFTPSPPSAKPAADGCGRGRHHHSREAEAHAPKRWRRRHGRVRAPIAGERRRRGRRRRRRNRAVVDGGGRKERLGGRLARQPLGEQLRLDLRVRELGPLLVRGGGGGGGGGGRGRHGKIVAGRFGQRGRDRLVIQGRRSVGFAHVFGRGCAAVQDELLPSHCPGGGRGSRVWAEEDVGRDAHKRFSYSRSLTVMSKSVVMVPSKSMHHVS